MKLLARILSHGFAIAIVLLLAVGLIYRGELFPEYNLPEILDIGKLAAKKEKTTTAQADQETTEPEAGKPAQTDLDDRNQATATGYQEGAGDSLDTAGTTASPVTVPDSDAIRREATTSGTQPPAGTESTAPPVMEEKETEVRENAVESTPVAPGPGDNGQQQDNELAESRAQMPDMSEPATAPDEEVTGSAAPAAETLPRSGTPEPPAADTAEPAAKQQENAYALLAAAREAYWLREYELAESKYQALTRLEPDNPDGYGELGNMYFSQGQWDEAASAYYEAGVRLVEQDLLDQAEELAAVIRGLNGGHADDLEEKIKAARSAAD
jgi:hypothetical protein